MYKYYLNYKWKHGKPYGIHPTEPEKTACSYKIIVDPYFKRFTIEKYKYENFDKIIYDSLLLDFRRLNLKDQTAWQRESLKEPSSDEKHYVLRDHEERAILIEQITFEEERCRKCLTTSIHGLPLAIHHTFYKDKKDPFNGVILFDMEGRIVMRKDYEIDEVTGEFTTLISENWEPIHG